MSNYKKYSELPESNSNNIKSDLIIDIESEEHKKKIVMNNKVVIIDIYGDWCQPCKAIAPRFANLSEKYKQHGFIFAKENVDKKISQNIRGVPAFQYFYNGKMLHSTTGADFADITEKVEGLLALKIKGV